MKGRTTTAAAILLLIAAAGGVWLLRDTSGRAEVAAARQSFLESGRILGIAIGDPIDDTRRLLDPLSVPTDEAPDAKEKAGRRIYRKLRGTEFDWVMVWGNTQGRITRIRAFYRADQRPPFGAIGDLAQADSVTAHHARWTLRRPGAPYVRLIAEGQNQQVQSAYMFSLELPGAQERYGAKNQ